MRKDTTFKIIIIALVIAFIGVISFSAFRFVRSGEKVEVGDNSFLEQEIVVEGLEIDEDLGEIEVTDNDPEGSMWVPPMEELEDFNYNLVYDMNTENYRAISILVEKSEIPNLQDHILRINPIYVEPDFEYIEIEENKDIVIMDVYWYVKENSGLEELFNQDQERYQEVVEDLYLRGVGGL